MAAVAGCVLGALATWYLVEVGIDLQGFPPRHAGVRRRRLRSGDARRLGFRLDGQIALYVVGLTLLAALYPAIKAGRITPVEAMRHH